MFTLVDVCDFQSFPVGGQVTFCRQVAEEFAGEVNLVGITTDPREPVGQWYRKVLGGTEFCAINFCRASGVNKPIIPMRLRNLVSVLLRRGRIFAKAEGLMLVNSPEVMIALRLLRFRAFRYVYIFHGVENPLEMPRYWWGRPLAGLFELLLFWSLRRAEGVLACSDEHGVNMLKSRMGKWLPPAG